MADSPARVLAETLSNRSPIPFSTGDCTNGGADDLTLLSIASGLVLPQKIQFFLDGWSTASANKGPIIQVGPTGGIVTSGYVGWGGAIGTLAANLTTSAGFKLSNEANMDAGIISDYLVTLTHMGANLWTSQSIGFYATTHCLFSTAYITLSGPLTQLQITTEVTAVTMDGGSIDGSYWI